MHTSVISSLFLCLTSIFVTFFFSRRQLLPAKTDRATVRLAVINDFAFQHASAITSCSQLLLLWEVDNYVPKLVTCFSIFHHLFLSDIWGPISSQTIVVSTLHSATQSGPMGRSEGMGVVDAQFLVLNEDTTRSSSSVYWYIFKTTTTNHVQTTHIAKRYVSAWLIRILSESNVGIVVVNKVLSILS